MEQDPKTVEDLQRIVGAITDEERRALEENMIRPYDSGLHDGDPLDQPDQSPGTGET